MPRYNAPFEIHVHGDVPLRPDVNFEQIQEALKPLWKYAGAKSLADGATSTYEEEPGIRFEQKDPRILPDMAVKVVFLRNAAAGAKPSTEARAAN